MRVWYGTIFLLLFAAGVLGANTFWAEEAFLIGFIGSSRLLQFQAETRSAGGFLWFALRYRLSIWISLFLGGAFRIGTAVGMAFCGLSGFCGGFLLTVWIRQNGLKGIFYMAAIGTPQMLLYLPAVFLLLKLISLTRKDRTGYWIFGSMLSGIFLLGMLSEYYWNPWILERL